MSEEEWLELTPAQLYALRRCHRERLEWEDLMTSRLQAQMINCNGGAEGKAVHPVDLMIFKPAKPKLSVKQLLQQSKEKMMKMKAWTGGLKKSRARLAQKIMRRQD